MMFNTVSYLVFLAAAVIGYWLLPDRAKRPLLLVASMLFYGLWRPDFVALIIFSAFIDYYFSLKIHASENQSRRRALMLVSIGTNLALLLYFKYTYFIIDNLALLPGIDAESWKQSAGHIVLPLGISFYTFLSISYTIDVYRREFTPIRSFPHYLTYVMFWPHMIAGPILRAHELIPQLVAPQRPHTGQVVEAFKAILFGLFLKVGLADNLAPMVDDAFATQPHLLGGLDVWTMAFAFGMQIYFDFAGYSMIAVGSAALLGIAFPDNFNWPYLATSPREFWRRWHITLSSWIRDYLYLPLSGLRAHSHSAGGIDIQFAQSTHFLRLTGALFLTWFIMGLWHGASWNFALWGLWHATFILAYRLTSPYLPAELGALGRCLGWAFTVSIMMLGWLPFRSPDVATTVSLFGRLLDPWSYTTLSFRENTYLTVFCIFGGMLALYGLQNLRLGGAFGGTLRRAGEFVAVAVAMFFVFIFLRPVAQFIYFQF